MRMTVILIGCWLLGARELRVPSQGVAPCASRGYQMLRSVFTVRHDRLAVALEGGHVIEVGDPNRCAVIIIGGATILCASMILIPYVNHPDVRDDMMAVSRLASLQTAAVPEPLPRRRVAHIRVWPDMLFASVLCTSIYRGASFVSIAVLNRLDEYIVQPCTIINSTPS